MLAVLLSGALGCGDRRASPDVGGSVDSKANRSPAVNAQHSTELAKTLAAGEVFISQSPLFGSNPRHLEAHLGLTGAVLKVTAGRSEARVALIAEAWQKGKIERTVRCEVTLQQSGEFSFAVHYQPSTDFPVDIPRSKVTLYATGGKSTKSVGLYVNQPRDLSVSWGTGAAAAGADVKEWKLAEGQETRLWMMVRERLGAPTTGGIESAEWALLIKLRYEKE